MTSGEKTRDGNTQTEDGSGISRRGFAFGACGAAAMVALGGMRFVPSSAVVRPPGAQDEEHFIGSCIRCEKCIEVCPNGVLEPAHIEAGLTGVRTPKINFSQAGNRLGGKIGWCDHCDAANDGRPRCMELCPTGAIVDDTSSTFESMRLGVAVINTDWCLAYRLKGCTVCKNACPLDAISFDAHNRPIVDTKMCNGCGSCEQACVSLESTSIGEGETFRDMTARAITVQVEA